MMDFDRGKVMNNLQGFPLGAPLQLRASTIKMPESYMFFQDGTWVWLGRDSAITLGGRG